jgi:hypothetical protein
MYDKIPPNDLLTSENTKLHHQKAEVKFIFYAGIEAPEMDEQGNKSPN